MRFTLWSFLVLVLSITAAESASTTLFPQPMRITREVEDSLSGTTARIEEYCAGNRVISVRGDRTAIADYEKGELLEIDRAAGTWSITRFEEIAKNAVTRPQSQRRAEVTPDFRTGSPRLVAGRSAEVAEATLESGPRIEVAFARELRLPRAAVEVLVGTAWPASPSPESRAVLAAVESSGSSSARRTAEGDTLALPLEQRFTWSIDGQTISMSNRILRVDDTPPPPDLVAIPPGARQVESPLTARKRLLEELDQLPSPPKN